MSNIQPNAQQESAQTLPGMLADVASRVTVTPGAGQLVETIHARGGKFGLVSGGFHEVVDRFAAPFGVDGILANRFHTAEGKLTGTVDGEGFGPLSAPPGGDDGQGAGCAGGAGVHQP